MTRFLLNLDFTSQVNFTRSHYMDALALMDSAVCEACAVSQAQAGRMAAPNVGHATRVYTNLCGHGVSIMRAAPFSRWSRSEFEHWHFGTIAGYARAILDGFLMFEYLMEPITSEAELNAKINVMHLNDCTRRIEFHSDIGSSQSELDKFSEMQEELRQRLKGNDFFKALTPTVQKSCLSGNKLMIPSRDQLVEKLGFDKGQFNAIYDLLSQHTHILPFSFYRIEPNGRGTGIENDADRGYFIFALAFCSAVLDAATETLVEQFTDTAVVRKGIRSQFSPGPASNKPKLPPKSKQTTTESFAKSNGLNQIIKDLFQK